MLKANNRMRHQDPLARLIDALRGLPGIGPKSAQRMAYALLAQRERGLHLANSLEQAMQLIQHCQRCNNYTDQSLCAICANPQRQLTTLCIVESPADVAAIEQSQVYQGGYYVLMGRISPLDGIGPEDIGLPALQQLIQDQPIQEIILALSPTIEGQTTVYFIQELLRPYSIPISQLAHGIPAGGELEFLDAHTIGHAFRHRGAFTFHATDSCSAHE